MDRFVTWRSWAPWLVIAAVTAVGTLGAALYAWNQPEEYTAHAVIAVRPTPQEDGSLPSAATVQLLAPRYVTYASSPHVLHSLAQELNLDYSLRNVVQVRMAPATTTITLSVTLSNASSAEKVANALASRTITESTNDSLLAVESVSAAETPSRSSGPPREIWTFLAFLTSTAIGVLVVYGIRALRKLLSPTASRTTSPRTSSLVAHGKMADATELTPRATAVPNS